MAEDFSNKNLQKAVIQNKDFRNASLSGSDLRGADFDGCDFTGADLTKVRTGLTPGFVILLFIVALAISLLSGYIAAKADQTIRMMLNDPDEKVKYAGIATIVIIVLAIVYGFWKGGNKTLLHVILPVIILSFILGFIYRYTGIGTGKGYLKLVLALMIVVIMIYVGTIARALAGSLSNIFFMIVAISGGAFGKSIAGAIGPVLFAVACMFLTKKALANAKEFVVLRKTIFFVIEKFGTSFRNTRLVNTNFAGSKLKDADFSGADLSSVNWGDAKKFNCKVNDEIVTDKKKKSHG